MRRKLPVVASVLLAVAFAASPVAAAEPGMTVDIGGTHLVGRVVVNVDVTFTCQPKPADAYPLTYTWGSLGGMESPSIIVSLRQAAGRQQAFGETTKYIDPAVVCIGKQQTITVAVLPDPSGPAFKAGIAAADVSGYASYYITDFDFYQQTDVPQNDTTGWMQVKIAK